MNTCRSCGAGLESTMTACQVCHASRTTVLNGVSNSTSTTSPAEDVRLCEHADCTHRATTRLTMPGGLMHFACNAHHDLMMAAHEAPGHEGKRYVTLAQGGFTRLGVVRL